MPYAQSKNRVIAGIMDGKQGCRTVEKDVPMVDYKLSNILLEHDERFFAYTALYCFSQNAIIEDKVSIVSLLKKL